MVSLGKRALVGMTIGTALALAPLQYGFGAIGALEVRADNFDDQMKEVQLIIKKLKMALDGTKDLDQLEKAGMSKDDVNRMRRAMELKIKKLTNQALETISTL